MILEKIWMPFNFRTIIWMFWRPQKLWKTGRGVFIENKKDLLLLKKL